MLCTFLTGVLIKWPGSTMKFTQEEAKDDIEKDDKVIVAYDEKQNEELYRLPL